MSEFQWPTVTVLIVTYSRPAEIRATIRALQQHLKYQGRLIWRLADDGSPAGYTHDIARDFPELDIQASVARRVGWGANVNLGMLSATSPYIYLNEDDYVALQDINLTAGVALLEALPDLGLIRYDGIVGHTLNLELREVTTVIGQVNYLRILKSSPHLNVYSNRPHLKHTRFHEAYGRYPIGKPLGVTEETFAHKVKDLTDGPDLACLTSGLELAFNHIGRSWQHTKEDVHDRGTSA